MSDQPRDAPAAVLLLSGGLDSYTAGAIARGEGFRLYALTVKYGQRHAREIESARAVAAALGVARHIELDVDLSAFGGSSLTSDAPVPKDRRLDATDIPSTYVPARNTVFLALALGWAEVLGAHDLVIGVNALDYSGYPDCRPEYVAAFERLASLATARGVHGETLPHPCAAAAPDEGGNHQARHHARSRLRPHPQLLRPRAGRPAVRPLRQLRTARRRIRRGGRHRPAGPAGDTAQRADRKAATISLIPMGRFSAMPLRRQLVPRDSPAARPVVRGRRLVRLAEPARTGQRARRAGRRRLRGPSPRSSIATLANLTIWRDGWRAFLPCAPLTPTGPAASFRERWTVVLPSCAWNSRRRMAGRSLALDSGEADARPGGVGRRRAAPRRSHARADGDRTAACAMSCSGIPSGTTTAGPLARSGCSSICSRSRTPSTPWVSKASRW